MAQDITLLDFIPEGLNIDVNSVQIDGVVAGEKATYDSQYRELEVELGILSMDSQQL